MASIWDKYTFICLWLEPSKCPASRGLWLWAACSWGEQLASETFGARRGCRFTPNAEEPWRWCTGRVGHGLWEAGTAVCWDFLSSSALVFLSASLVVFPNFKLTSRSIQCFLMMYFLRSFLKLYENHRIYHLSYCQVYRSVVVSIFTLLCSRSPELFHIGKLKLCTHWTPPVSVPTAPGGHCSPFCFCGLDCLRCFTEVGSYGVCLCVRGLLHLA